VSCQTRTCSGRSYPGPRVISIAPCVHAHDTSCCVRATQSEDAEDRAVVHAYQNYRTWIVVTARDAVMSGAVIDSALSDVGMVSVITISRARAWVQ